MLRTLLIIVIALWVLGMLTSYTMGGLLHTLLAIALIVLIINWAQGRRGTIL